MKQEIQCESCGGGTKKRFPKAPITQWDGEYVGLQWGVARHPMMCDACGVRIKLHDKVLAFSIYTDDRPYFPWEHEYLQD